MKISIIIPNYNGQDLLKKNLPKVFEAISLYKNGKAEIIVIDDCSTDNSIEGIKSLELKIQNYLSTLSSRPKGSLKLKIIRNEKNMGFSSTVNKGVKEATGDLILLLNTDVVPKNNFLDPLVKHFKDEKVFAVGCMDKSIEDGKVILRGRGIGTWKRGFLVHSRGEVNKTNTLWVSGGSGAFRKSVWDYLGGFDELYNPFYWEDIDLSYRALKSGYRILFEPKSIVVHEHEEGAINSTYSNFKVKTIAYRNQFIFVWKNATDLNLQFSHLLWLPYHFLKALIEKDLAFFKSFLMVFFLLPKIIKHSIEDQRLFVKSDKEVMREFLE